MDKTEYKELLDHLLSMDHTLGALISNTRRKIEELSPDGSETPTEGGGSEGGGTPPTEGEGGSEGGSGGETDGGETGGGEPSGETGGETAPDGSGEGSPGTDPEPPQEGEGAGGGEPGGTTEGEGGGETSGEGGGSPDGSEGGGGEPGSGPSEGGGEVPEEPPADDTSPDETNPPSNGGDDAGSGSGGSGSGDGGSGGGSVPAPPVTGTHNAFGPGELSTALKNAKGGEVIVAKAGDYGVFAIGGVRTPIPVTVIGENADFERMALTNSGNLILQSLNFVPKGKVIQSGGAIPYLLTGDRATSEILVQDCDFDGALDADDFMTWSLAKWRDQKIGAAFFQGQNVTLKGCAALGVNFGFNLIGDNGRFEDLRVCGFSADSFRVGGSNMVGRRLWATDAYAIDGNHPDAIQSFNKSKTLVGHDFEDCILMEHSTKADLRGAVGAALQIIGYHDGPYDQIAYRRIIGGSSSYNAYHVNSCPTHSADKVMMFTQPGPRGGSTRLRVSARSVLTDVYLDKAVSGGGQTTGKPDYAKLDAFLIPALKSNPMPDIKAIMGW